MTEDRVALNEQLPFALPESLVVKHYEKKLKDLGPKRKGDLAKVGYRTTYSRYEDQSRYHYNLVITSLLIRRPEEARRAFTLLRDSCERTKRWSLWSLELKLMQLEKRTVDEMLQLLDEVKVPPESKVASTRLVLRRTLLYTRHNRYSEAYSKLDLVLNSSPYNQSAILYQHAGMLALLLAGIDFKNRFVGDQDRLKEAKVHLRKASALQPAKKTTELLDRCAVAISFLDLPLTRTL